MRFQKVNNKRKWLTIGLVAFLGAAIGVGSGIGYTYSGVISTALAGTGVSDKEFDSETFVEAAQESDALCQKIAEEGITLLKNNGTLPLQYAEGAAKKINLFGWSSSDQGFLLSGIGSGSSTINPDKKVSLLDAFEEGGYEVNQELVDFYNAYDSTKYGYNSARIKIIEPKISEYSQDFIDACVDYSDTAVIVISRISGENVGEIPMTQSKSKGGADTTRSYIELAQEEEDLIDMAALNFENVIVLINSTNQMQLNYLDIPEVDAVLNCQILGQSGAMAIPKILDGRINPSGRTVDTYSYDFTKEPSYVNRFANSGSIVYDENLYFGYRWYETADAEHYFDNEERISYAPNGSEVTLKGYDAMVQYPFGHGLSYTTFEWSVDKVKIINGGAESEYSSSNKELRKDSKIEFTLSCTNTGTVAGKDVMEIYYHAPYTTGGIEKSEINLVQFVKTASIDPGLTQMDIKVTFDAYDMASFDAYDKNDNTYTTFELDSGDYKVSLRKNSHVLASMAQGNPAEYDFHVDSTIVYDKDPVTGEEVTNRFTGPDAYAGVEIDGNNAFTSNKPVFLSREDFISTFPTKRYGAPNNTSVVNQGANYSDPTLNQTTMPALNQNNNLLLKTRKDGSKANLNDLQGNGEDTIYNEDLIREIAEDYDGETLTKLVDQVSAEEACHLVEDSGFGTPALESIGKPTMKDFDGPAGFNSNTQTGTNTGKWTAFPSETLVGQTWSQSLGKQMGLAVGLEGQATGLSGWYAPGVNLHRSPYNGRNYEYYSEDGVLNGYMAASVIQGAKANGLYCYLKHFVVSEEGNNPNGVYTWITEQNLREIYLKPFEIATKNGCNAIMSAFNCVGSTWAGSNRALLNDILREEWGFRGAVITDWSNGGGVMNTKRGVRAGNDIWLNSTSGGNVSKLGRSDPTEVYCAKLAVRNVIYMFCSTYVYAKDYDHSKDNVTVEIGSVQTKTTVDWFKPTLIAVDVVAVLGLAAWLLFGAFGLTFRKE